MYNFITNTKIVQKNRSFCVYAIRYNTLFLITLCVTRLRLAKRYERENERGNWQLKKLCSFSLFYVHNFIIISTDLYLIVVVVVVAAFCSRPFFNKITNLRLAQKLRAGNEILDSSNFFPHLINFIRGHFHATS